MPLSPPFIKVSPEFHHRPDVAAQIGRLAQEIDRLRLLLRFAVVHCLVVGVYGRAPVLSSAGGVSAGEAQQCHAQED